jgi:mannan endo-1,4-beta-mannosidase
VSSSTAKPSSTSKTSTGSTSTSSGTISKVNGLKFTIDGQTKYFAGTNCYWLAFLTNNADVDLVLDHLKASGLKILRIWGFNDVNSVPGTGTVYFQYHSNGKSTINTGEYGLQRLDYVVQAAASRGIKLIINFVNNWSDYGKLAGIETA